MALKSGEAIAEIAGNSKLAMKYRQVAANLQLTINKIFWNEEKSCTARTGRVENMSIMENLCRHWRYSMV